MRMKKLLALVLALLLGLSATGGALAQSVDGGYTRILGLKVNYQTNPLGISMDDIRFGWRMESNLVGQGQGAYQIMVTKDAPDGELVWDSGLVESGLSTGIAYGGPALDYESRYYWTVAVTDLSGQAHMSQPAFFETGTQWEGVSWIVPSADPGAGNTYAVLETPAEGDTPAVYSRHGGAPLLRMEGALTGEVASARLYMTALGNYEAYINGQKVLTTDNEGNAVEAVFAPGWTDYKYFTNYQTYDVTDQLSSAADGQFVLGVAMHKGWYAGLIADWGDANYESIGVTGTEPSTFDARQLALLGKLVITYADGATQVITTNDDEWKSIASPILDNDFYNGESYDANLAKQLAGWNRVGFADDGWYEVSEFNGYTGELRPSNGALARVADSLEVTPVRGYTYKEAETIYPEIMPPPVGSAIEQGNDWFGEVVEHPVDLNAPITVNPDDILIVDMGQNMVGVAEITVSGPQGATVKMRHAEMLNDGRLNPELTVGSTSSDGPKGTLYYKSLRREEAQTNYYVLSDEAVQTYRPTSAYMGFEYLEITTDQPITISGIRGIVITSVDNQIGRLETSDDKVNQLISNVLWSHLGNYTTVPTDCPQRNERQGWTGDAQLFAQSAVFNFDSTTFLDVYLQMLKANCDDLGSFGGTVPGTDTDYNSGWSDAGVIIPWVLYLQTGDSAFIQEMYDTMDLYMDNVYANGYNLQWYGDWVSFVGAYIQYLNAVYQIYTTQLMAQMAQVIGREDMVAKYQARYAQLRDAFMAEPIIETREVSDSNPRGIERVGGGFVYENGDLMSYGPVMNSFVPVLQDNAQTALLWALKLGLYRDEDHRQYLIGKLVENIRNEGGQIRPGQYEDTLAVGFLGVNVLLPTLTQSGANDVAYDLLLQEKLPSWLFSVVNGSTTIWERWNAYTYEDSFYPFGMNSFNHYSYGACIEWMYEYMAGINQVESAPGFKEIILQPTIDESGRISYVNGSYESVYGHIASNWTTQDGKLAAYTAIVPANTQATLYLPVDASAMEGFEAAPGMTYLGMVEHNGQSCASFTLASGGYDLTVDNGLLVASLQEGLVA